MKKYLIICCLMSTFLWCNGQNLTAKSNEILLLESDLTIKPSAGIDFNALATKYGFNYSKWITNTTSSKNPSRVSEKKLDYQALLYYYDQFKEKNNEIENITITTTDSQTFDNSYGIQFKKLEKLEEEYYQNLRHSIKHHLNFHNINSFYSLLLDTKFEGASTELTKLFFERKEMRNNINALSAFNLASDFKSSLNAYSEIVSGYLWKGKFIVAALVQASDTLITKESLIEQLTIGGGNLNLNYIMPALNGNIGKYFKSSLFLNPNIGITIPQLNYSVDDFNFNYGYDLQLNAELGTSSDALSFYAGLKLSHIRGNDNLKSNIGVTDNFNLRQFELGLKINETFRIGVNFFSGSENVENFLPPTLINFQLIPQ